VEGENTTLLCSFRYVDNHFQFFILKGNVSREGYFSRAFTPHYNILIYIKGTLCNVQKRSSICAAQKFQFDWMILDVEVLFVCELTA